MMAAVTPPTALVLTAGLGTRLRPLSWLRAKPAMPIAGEPLVVRVLRWLHAHGIRDAILNLHHRAESITRAVGDGSDVGLRVRYSWENPILGSAGGPRRAFALVPDDELLIVNGDTITDVDIPALIRAHRSSDALVTLALIPQVQPADYGGVLLDPDGRVTGYARRGESRAGWHFVGVQIARREAFAGLDDGRAAASIGGQYDRLALERRGSVRGWTTSASFLDVGTPETYLRTCLALGPNVSVGQRSRVSASSRLAGCVLWDDVTIEDEVILTECVVADRVVVPRQSRYHRAVLLRSAEAPIGSEDRVEGDLHIAPLGGGR